MDYDGIAGDAAREADARPGQGAYVQARVWVEIEPGHPPTDEGFREAARRQWSWGGEIEIDDDAEVSRGGHPPGGGEPPPARSARLRGRDDRVASLPADPIDERPSEWTDAARAGAVSHARPQARNS